MMLLLEEERRAGRREKTRREEEEDQDRQAPHAAPGIHLDPRPLLTSKGHRATPPFILIMEEAETVSHNMALLLCHAACHPPSAAPASGSSVLIDAWTKV